MTKMAANPLLALGVALGTSAITALPGMAQTALPTQPTSAALLNMLSGNAAVPGGVVSIPTGGQTVRPGFNFSPPNPFSASLTVKFGPNTLVFSSLTEADWNTSVGGGQNLTQKWLSDAFNANGFYPTPTEFTALVNAFIANKGRQYVSDPKIAYLSPTVDAIGNIKVGLAGFLNASDLLTAAVIGTPFEGKVPPTVKASELAKVVINGGSPQYLYGFTGTNSGQSLLGTDFNPVCTGGAASNNPSDPKAECPFTANYEVTLGGLTPSATLTDPSLNWVNPQSFPLQQPIYQLACSNGTGTVSSTFAPCNTTDYNNAINVGATANNPLVCTVDPITNICTFSNVPIGSGGLGTTEILYLDPAVAVGYDYSVTGGPLFTGFLIPYPLPQGDSEFTLELEGFGSYTLHAGTLFDLLAINPNGFSKFRLTGIDPTEMLGPNAPFLSGVTFTTSGTATITQTPILQDIPEPSNLFGLGLLGFGAFFKRQLNKKKQSQKDTEDK